MIRMLVIDSVTRFLRWWPFFLEGYNFLRKNAKWERIDSQDFFKALLNASASEESSLLVVAVNSGGQPLGFAAATNDSSYLHDKVANLFAMYANGIADGVHPALQVEIEQWARSRGFRELITESYRFSSAAQRWFQKRGFDKTTVLYSKKL